MSETKKERTFTEIQQEYASICMKAGDIQYRIKMFENDLETANKTLQDLNLEAAAAKAREAEAAVVKPAIEEQGATTNA